VEYKYKKFDGECHGGVDTFEQRYLEIPWHYQFANYEPVSDTESPPCYEIPEKL
jgi:hypothetical protein